MVVFFIIGLIAVGNEAKKVLRYNQVRLLYGYSMVSINFNISLVLSYCVKWHDVFPFSFEGGFGGIKNRRNWMNRFCAYLVYVKFINMSIIQFAN